MIKFLALRTLVTNTHRLDQRNPFARVGSWVFSFWYVMNLFAFYFGARTFGPEGANSATLLLVITIFTFILFLYFCISSRIWEFIVSIVYSCNNLADIYNMFIRTILSSWTPLRCVKLVACLLVLISRWNCDVIILTNIFIMCKSTCCNVWAVGSISAWLIETARSVMVAVWSIFMGISSTFILSIHLFFSFLFINEIKKF